jgi:hypothetical protein
MLASESNTRRVAIGTHPWLTRSQANDGTTCA